jgi:hypothetical protein
MPAGIIAGSVISGLSGLAASSAQRKAGNRAAATAQRQYDITRQDTALARGAGDDAIAALARLTGLSVPQRGQTVGSSPFSKADWDSISPVWGNIRQAASYDDISAQHLPQGLSPEATQFLRSNWGSIRPAANLGDVDWNSFTHSGINYPTAPTGTEPTSSPDASMWDEFRNSPDYAFVNEEGQRSIDRSLAARGKALSGEGVREGIRFAEGLATTNVNNYLDRLRGIAELGQNAVNTSANVGTNTAAMTANAEMYKGDARASGYEALNNSVQGGLQNWLLLQQFGKGGGTSPFMTNNYTGQKYGGFG